MEPFYKIDSLEVQFFLKPKLYWLRLWHLSQAVTAITNMVTLCKSDLFHEIMFFHSNESENAVVIL